MRKPSESYLKLKKATDKILSGAGLVVLSPVFAGIAIAIKLEDGITAPVFFKQKRVGIHKSHFMLYKFRSMQTDTPHDMPTHLLTDPEQYLTGTGRWLRKTSLDELPQLFNVLKGDMTFVGTRPEVPKYTAHYTEEMMATFLLPAGVTSRTSIEYKDEEKLLENAENADEVYINEVLPAKMVYNLREIEKFSFLRDISTMIKTVIAVIK